MSGKYVSPKAERQLNDPSPEVVRGQRVTAEAFAKSSVLRNLPTQTKQNYGLKDYNR